MASSNQNTGGMNGVSKMAKQGGGPNAKQV